MFNRMDSNSDGMLDDVEISELDRGHQGKNIIAESCIRMALRQWTRQHDNTQNKVAYRGLPALTRITSYSSSINPVKPN